MNKTAHIFPALLAAFIAVFLWLGLTCWAYDRQVIVFPLIVGIPTVLLCLYLATRATTVARGMPRAPADNGRMRGDFANFLWLVAVLPVMAVFGLSMGAVVYLIVFLKLRGENWFLSLGLAAGFMFFVYVIFVLTLKVSLPPGLLGQ